MKQTYLWMILLLVSCGKAEVLKEVSWKDNCLSWEVLDGGATSSYRWQIMYTKDGEDSKHLIFESYSEPYIRDIKVHQDNLLILVPNFREKVNDTISIDLEDVKEFIDEPVVYERDALKNSNRYYRELDFVKEERKNSQRFTTNE